MPVKSRGGSPIRERLYPLRRGMRVIKSLDGGMNAQSIAFILCSSPGIGSNRTFVLESTTVMVETGDSVTFYDS